MARFLVIGGFLAAVFWVFGIVDCVVQPASRHRGVPKGVWIAIVIVIPVLGAILWFTLGRTRRGRSARDERFVPFDDEPRSGGVTYGIPQAEQDRRIRELEAELARLDERGDTDEPGPKR